MIMDNHTVSSTTLSPRRRGAALLAGLCAALILAGCVTTSTPHERSGSPAPGATAPAKPTTKSVPKRKTSGPVVDEAPSPIAPVESPVADQRRRVGEATYYASDFQGRPTASGEPYDGQAMTAAHKTLPFGTRVRVTLLDSGDTAVVRINDRGPFVPGRIIDVSERAAEQLGLVDAGTAEVRLQVLE
ncbi:septal ring lytic transglycosylase RlpA family protein [Salinicola aestuarinus]|uniref:septal ring lytic transglycosylase RlpA family protein n=1 Tax=Salinicola aestuarinus TaxID=1949082 RepID=UPI001FDAB8F8|nr:septal ring lytic transglycosylase RlpA family protein [Salinicola aestuarinus]